MPLSVADVRALDGNAEALGVPVSELMENAGAAVAKVVEERYPEGLVVVLAGLGNNGGDGLVVARLLHEAGRRVVGLVAGEAEDMKTEAAQEALSEALEAGVTVGGWSPEQLERAVGSADVFVDALLGVGVRGALRSPYDAIVAAARGRVEEAAKAGGNVPVVAVDVPTGSGSDSGVGLVPDVTVTFHDMKTGMDAASCGDVVVADIGIPAAAERFVGPGDLSARYPRSRSGAKKGDHGRLLFVVGGPYTGAPVLAALGALGTGTDLLHVATAGPAVDVVRGGAPEAMVHALDGDALGPEHVDSIIALFDAKDVMLIGPGLGQAPGTNEAVRALLGEAAKRGLRCLVDADGFIADAPDIFRAVPGVLTPHGGEFQRLGGIDVHGLDADGRIKAVQDWLGDSDQVVLLKGPDDVIVARERAVINQMHHPVMTTGGTGDVLAGCVAALMGRGASAFDAARVGAFLAGSAGRLAHAERGYGVRATDVAAAIPRVLGHWFGYEVE